MDGELWTQFCVELEGGKKTIPFNAPTNTPIFYMAPSSCAYCMFASIFKACEARTYPAFTCIFEAFEAPYYRREKVVQFPGRRHAIDGLDFIPEEFVAEENVNYCKDVSACEGVNADDKMVKMSILPLPPQDEEPSKVI